MGTFSVRSLRADIQNVAMRNNRAFPSLMRFLVFYLCTCVAVYLFFRYYLTNERDYGTPIPAAVTHDNIFRPLESFSSIKVAASPNKLFEKLYKHKVKKRPGTISNDLSWHKAEDDTMPRLEESLEKSDKFQPDFLNEKADNNGNSSNASVANNSNTSYQNVDYKGKRNDILMARNSTNEKANISIVTPNRENKNNVDLNLKQITSNPNSSSMISGRFQDFRREWFRQRRARIDWQSMIKPCSDNMAWGLVKNHWGKSNRSSGRASEVVYLDIKPAGEFSKIFIQSKTSDNRTKMIGGDTWRVYLRGPSNVAATLFDHQNGTYEALFLLAEPGVYEAMIYLDYSLCDGFKDPPRDWFIKGNAQGKYQKDGLLGTLDDYLKEPFKNGNPVIITIPEAQMNTSFIESNKWSLPLGYKQSGTLWIYGDSLAVRLTNSAQTRFLCRRFYMQCLVSYNWIYPIFSEEAGKKQDDDLDFRPKKVIETILGPLRSPQMQREDSVLLLNLGLHFTVGVNFTTYKWLIGDLINRLKETKVDLHGKMVPKYKAKVIWKTTSAIHKENALVQNKTNWRFFTTQRVALFSTYAMSAMCKAGFDVIDVYPMTASYPGGTQDEVHYPNHVFSAMETLLEKYKVHKNKRVSRNEKKNRIKRCIG